MKKFIPGCFINRLQKAVSNEIFQLIEEGYINPEDVDPALKTSLAVRWLGTGYIQGMDFGGLDVVLQARTLSPVKASIKFLEDKVARGQLGVKSGEGFYSYEGKSIEEWIRQRDISFIKIVELMEKLEPIGNILPDSKIR